MGARNEVTEEEHPKKLKERINKNCKKVKFKKKRGRASGTLRLFRKFDFIQRTRKYRRF